MQILLGFLIVNLTLLAVSTHIIRDSQRVQVPHDLSDRSQEEFIGNTIRELQRDSRDPRRSTTRDDNSEERRTNLRVAGETYFDKHPEVLEVVTADAVALGESNDIATDVLSVMEKKKKKHEWSKGTFTKAIKELGIFNVEGLKVIKLKEDEVQELKTMKNRTKVVRATSPRVRKGKTINGVKTAANKRANGVFDLCAEYVDSIYVLAHDSSQLAYQITSVRCEGTCTSATFNLELGSCNLATKTTIVYCIDSDGSFVPKTIEPGCACECLNYQE